MSVLENGPLRRLAMDDRGWLSCSSSGIFGSGFMSKGETLSTAPLGVADFGLAGKGLRI